MTTTSRRSTTTIPTSGGPPPYGTTPPSQPPPYGGSSTTTPSTSPSPLPPLCPTYNNAPYTDTQGATYNIACDTTLTGTPYTPPPGSYKRQASYGAPTIQSCLALCDAAPACVAVSLAAGATECQLLSSVTGTSSSPGGVAAYKVSGPPPVQTVTVCANRRTAYTTVWTTATMTTCPAEMACTTGAMGM